MASLRLLEIIIVVLVIIGGFMAATGWLAWLFERFYLYEKLFRRKK